MTTAISIQSSKYFWTFASIFGLSSGFFMANFYSWGLHASFLSVMIPLLIAAPLYGAFWFNVHGWLLHKTGTLLGGSASFEQCRNAVALSKIPYLISLSLWIVLVATASSTLFIHSVDPVATVFIILISTVVNISSFAYLTRSVKAIQSFGLGRAFCNSAIGLLLSYLVSLIIILAGRYIYLSI